MSIMGQNKGKRAEREVVRLLQPVVNEVCEALGREVIMLERNLMQSHKGGYDIVGLDWLALEVKHREQFAIEDWWKQTVRQARGRQEPVLFYRRNKVKFRVRMRGSLWHGVIEHECPVDIAVEDFLGYFKLRLLCELR